MSFKYVYIPALESSAILELTGSKSGGLENDALRKGAEDKFGAGAIDQDKQRSAVAEQLRGKGVDASKIDEILQSNIGGRLAGSVEIITLAVPTAANGFTSVSLYCDGNIAFKQPGNTPNARATALARACGHHNLVVMGDCFAGRALDDERREWERADFTLEDVSPDATWVRVAASANKGKNLDGYSTSGALSALHGSAAKHTAPTPAAAPAAPTASEFSEHELFVWTQGEEEVEVRMKVPAGMLSKHLQVQISADRLFVGHKNAGHILGVDARFCAQVDQDRGAKLGGIVNASESTWSVADEREGRMLTVTLAKAAKKQWKGLLA